MQDDTFDRSAMQLSQHAEVRAGTVHAHDPRVALKLLENESERCRLQLDWHTARAVQANFTHKRRVLKELPKALNSECFLRPNESGVNSDTPERPEISAGPHCFELVE
nr:hypothetical protein [Mycetocola reblochoni]